MGKLICKCCGNKVTLLGLRRTEDGDIICDVCARTKYKKCRDCNNYIPYTCQRSICKECDENVYKRTLNAYSTKPIPRFQSKYGYIKGGRYFGMELELSNISPESCYTLFNDLYKDKLIYNKSDGSLRNGTEIVTNPCDRKSMNKLLSRMKDGLEIIKSQKGYKDNAGIHIHVTRKSISPIDIYKLSYLFNYKTDSVFKRALYYITGRNVTSTSQEDDYRYCQIGTMNNKKNLKYTDNRYCAINLSNTNTVEFRMFKTEADIDIIKSYFDFVEDSLEYIHTHGLRYINCQSFLVWLKANSRSDIIKRRIKNFERHNQVFEVKCNIYSISKELLKGIHVDMYKNLLKDLRSCSSIDTATRVLEAYKENKGNKDYEYAVGGGSTDFGNSLEIVKILDKTLKAVYINKILKEVKECA